MSEPKYLFRCGTPPGPGVTVWVGDREYVVTEDGQGLRPITEAVERTPVPARFIEWLFCPACLLPRFIPGHRLRGCSQAMTRRRSTGRRMGT